MRLLKKPVDTIVTHYLRRLGNSTRECLLSMTHQNSVTCYGLLRCATCDTVAGILFPDTTTLPYCATSDMRAWCVGELTSVYREHGYQIYRQLLRKHALESS